MTSDFLPSKEWAGGGSVLVAGSWIVLWRRTRERPGALFAHFRDILPLFLPPNPVSLPLVSLVWLSAGNVLCLGKTRPYFPHAASFLSHHHGVHESLCTSLLSFTANTGLL